MNRESPTTIRNEDSDLTGYYAFVVGRAKRYYKLLGYTLTAFTVVVIAYTHFAEPVYLALAALTPPKDALLNISGLSGSAEGLASIGRRLGLGIGGGASGSNQDLFDEYTRVLQSYRLASKLAGSRSFLALAFPRNFDPATGHLKKRSGFVADTIREVKSALGLPLATDSDEDQVFKFLTDSLTVSQPHDPTTSISEVILKFNDGPSAQKILEIILAEADAQMRTDRGRDIAARIAYLQDQLQKVTLDGQRTALISLLTMQQSTMMIIAADHRYASYVVEPPHAPQKPAWPNVASTVGLILFLAIVSWGLAISFLPERRLARFASTKSSSSEIGRKRRGDVNPQILP